MDREHRTRCPTGELIVNHSPRRFRIVGVIAAVLAGSGISAREVGIDVSQFQGTINWTQVKTAKAFAFIRATRGGQGTSGTGDTIDDTTFSTNIVNAKAAGLLVAPYHFARPDILTGGTITSDAQDEARHFLNIAGAYMAPGYLRPVLDLETNGSGFSKADLSSWANTFCSYIVAAKGAKADPIIYVNTSFAYDLLDRTVNVHALWIARPLASPYAPQTDVPPTPSGYNNPYGVWNRNTTGTPDNPGEWAFWQYGQSISDTPPSGGTPVPGISGNVDLNVFHSETGSITSFLVPEPATGATALVAMMLAIGRRPLGRQARSTHETDLTFLHTRKG